MTSNRFSRADPVLQHSLPRNQFARDFTTLNSYYWGGASSAAAVAGVLRHLSDTDDFRTKLGLLHARFDRALNHTTSKYAAELQLSDDWHRRATLIMLLSAFEKYMSNIAATAVASDPALENGFPKVIEGISLQKRGLSVGHRDLERLTKGDWSARASAYERLFGNSKSVLPDISSLEKMRVARNKIAHGFATTQGTQKVDSHIGSMIGARRSALASDHIRVSEKELLKWLDVIQRTVSSIDAHLMKEYIGNFEIAVLFHAWSEDMHTVEDSFGLKSHRADRTKARNAKRFLAQALNYPSLSMDYVKSLIAFVDAA